MANFKRHRPRSQFTARRFDFDRTSDYRRGNTRQERRARDSAEAQHVNDYAEASYMAHHTSPYDIRGPEEERHEIRDAILAAVDEGLIDG